MHGRPVELCTMNNNYDCSVADTWTLFIHSKHIYYERFFKGMLLVIDACPMNNEDTVGFGKGGNGINVD
ncbi:hypothetical protein ANABIO32_24860 [Rossellomorea marisflavi]|nr:hypothetical protein ANABIO32_24860 [Rossellomorea marisflavi]